MHTFPIGPSAVYEWTEFFKGWRADKNHTHHRDYFGKDGPVAEVEGFLASSNGMTMAKYKQMDFSLKKLAGIPPKPEEMLTYGSGFGALEEIRRGSKIASGAPFNHTELAKSPETRLWHELLTDGKFSATTLDEIPLSIQVSDGWLKLLLDTREDKTTWLHEYLIGVCLLERGERNASSISFKKSIALRPTALAARNLAIIAKDQNETVALYQHAFELYVVMKAGSTKKRVGKDLTREMAMYFVSTKEWGALETLLEALGSDIYGKMFLVKDQLLDAQMGLLLHKGKEADLDKLLKIVTRHCFPTYAGARGRLVNYWYQALLKKAEIKKRGKLTRLETVHLRRRIGCDGDHLSTLEFDAPCTRGPPNIGLAY